MTLAVTILAVAVAVLAVLVVGLLRSHAAVLRRLHQLGAGEDRLPGSQLPLVAADVPAPTSQPTGRAVADLEGVAPDGAAVAIAVDGTDHDTVLAFLSSTCATCEAFWEQLARGVELPTGTRLVVVTKGPDQESPSEVAALAPTDIPVVMSTEAWEANAIPGSPYVIHVDGPSGRARGEGTGGSWEQVAKLLAQATGDLAFLEPGHGRSRKTRSDAERERDTDRALLEAGIEPGDPSLYQRFDGTEVAS